MSTVCLGACLFPSQLSSHWPHKRLLLVCLCRRCIRAHLLVIHKSIVKVSYIKAIDVWMGTCMAFVFGAMIEFTIVNYWSRRKVVFAPLAKFRVKHSTRKYCIVDFVYRRACTTNSFVSATAVAPCGHTLRELPVEATPCVKRSMPWCQSTTPPMRLSQCRRRSNRARRTMATLSTTMIDSAVRSPLGNLSPFTGFIPFLLAKFKAKTPQQNCVGHAAAQHCNTAAWRRYNIVAELGEKRQSVV